MDLPQGKYAFVLRNDGKLVVAINSDGSVTYGPGISKDEAAKAFWYGVAENRPLQLQRDENSHVQVGTSPADAAPTIKGN